MGGDNGWAGIIVLVPVFLGYSVLQSHLMQSAKEFAKKEDKKEFEKSHPRKFLMTTC